MRFNKLLALLLAVLMIFTQLPVMAAEEVSDATFTVSAISPMDGERNVPIVNTKVDITFSEPVDPATLSMATISVTSGAFRSVVATSATTATIYLDRDVLRLGEKYTVTLKNGIKSLTGASLVEKKITFTMTREVPSYRQITNQGLDDPNFLSGFIGDTRNNLSVVNDSGNNVLRFATPGWNEGAIKMNPAVAGGTTYTGRLRFKLETPSQAWIAALIYQPGNQNFYRTGTVRQDYEANTWYTLEASWTVPDDADTSKFQFLFAVKDPNIVAYVDDIHFFEAGNDVDPPVLTAGGAGASYTVLSQDNSPLNKFKALGVIANGAEADGTISRIDLAKALLNLKGLYQYPAVTSTQFTDVNESDMPIVKSVVDLGLMNGASATEFEPTDKVTLDQVVKTIVNLMGWGEVANQHGGYPGGYNKVATDLGLTKNLSATAGTRFTTADFAMLLNNALDAEVLDVVRYNGSMDAKFLVPNGTFLDTFFALGYGKGVIEANENTYLYQDGSLAKDRVLINDTIYTCDADVQDYLGYEVYYYYEKSVNNEPPVIKYISGLATNNEVVEFSTLDDAYLKYDDNTYYYAADPYEEADEYEIEKNRNVIYNGKYLGTYKNDASTFVPAYGKVKIIDNGKGYDTVVITDIRTVFVSAVDTVNKVIYDDKGGLPVSLEKSDDFVIYDNEGGTWSFKDIKQWCVISVIQSKDGELTTIYLSSKSVTGPVVSISTEDGSSEIVIGDDFYGQSVRTSYKVVDSYYDVSTLSLTSKGTFYLDWTGKIAAFSVGTAASGVGYLIDAVVDYESDLDGLVEFKIFDVSGRMLILTGDKRITVDIERVKEPERVVELLSNGTSEVLPQLVLFTTNREGLLTQIDTAYNNLPNTSNYLDVTLDSKDNEDGFRITYSSVLRSNPDDANFKTMQEAIDAGWDFKTLTDKNGIAYEATARSFNNKVLLTTKHDPKIFMVPWKDAKLAEDDQFMICTSAWDLGQNNKYVIDAYQYTGSTLIADYVVVYMDGMRTAYFENTSAVRGIVAKMKQVMKNDETVTEVTLADGKVYYAKEASYLSGVSVGDYVKLFTSQDNNIYKNTKVIYDVDTGAFDNDGKTGFDNYTFYYVGDVYEKLDTTVKLVSGIGNITKVNPDVDYDLMNLSGTNMYLYHRAKKEVMPASMGDILDYVQSGDDKSSLFIVSSKAKANTVYIVTE